MDDQGIVKSLGSSSEKKKKPNIDKVKPQSSKEPKADKPAKSLSSNKTHRSSQDTRIDELDQKWSERFNRPEALLLQKSLEQPEPAFTTVKVTPTHSPPHSSVVSSKPFIRPTNTDRTILSLQICLVIFRLLPSRPANQPKERCPLINLQIWLVLTRLCLSKYLADRHQSLQEDRAHLQ